jgi:hypothetical protein
MYKNLLSLSEENKKKWIKSSYISIVIYFLYNSNMLVALAYREIDHIQFKSTILSFKYTSNLILLLLTIIAIRIYLEY